MTAYIDGRRIVMVPVLLAAGVAVEAVGGFAAAATSAEVLAAIISGGTGVAIALIKRNAAMQVARYALGAAIAPWVGGVLLAGTVLYGGYKIIEKLSDKDKIELHAGKDGLDVKASGRVMTQDEFNKTLRNDKLIQKLRANLRDKVRECNAAPVDVYLSTIDTIRSNPVYKNISDDDKIKLARRLTNGLFS